MEDVGAEWCGRHFFGVKNGSGNERLVAYRETEQVSKASKGNRIWVFL